MSVNEVILKRKTNGYVVQFSRYLSSEEYVYRSLPEALQKAAWELDYGFKGEIKFPGNGWREADE